MDEIPTLVSHFYRPSTFLSSLKKIEIKKEKEKDSKKGGNFDFTFVKSFQKYQEDIFLKLKRTIYHKWNIYVHCTYIHFCSL